MKVFLTGGTGFIGSYVALELAAQGHQVSVLARNPQKVPALAQFQKIEIVRGDITDQPLLKRLVEGKDACVHIALNYTRNTGWEVMLDDTLPVVFLSDAAAEARVRHFVYTSSTAVDDSLYMCDGESPRVKVAGTALKHCPATFYGATKAASENYLTAQSYRSKMRVNIIRPGYTFGNPALKGGSMQNDRRFYDIVQKAVQNKPIELIKNDGTQFIFAGDLAKLYIAVLNGPYNRRTYFGLGQRFISWHEIALEAVKKSGSKSEIRLEDKGWGEDGLLWDVSDMQRDFGLVFDAWTRIVEHLDYLIQVVKNQEARG